MLRRATLIGIALLLLAPAAWAGTVKLETEEQKTLYALGHAIAMNLKGFALDAKELEFVRAGLTDGVLDNPAPIDVLAYQPKIRQFQQDRGKILAEKEKTAAAEFLAKAAEEEGVVKTDSGLLYLVIEEGTGESPAAEDRVKVHYHGTLRDGSVFDSSVQRGEPATFALNRVIPCWTEGVQMMKVGGKSKLVCPSDIAYGDRGSPPRIGPGAALVFEVELLEIVK